MPKCKVSYCDECLEGSLCSKCIDGYELSSDKSACSPKDRLASSGEEEKEYLTWEEFKKKYNLSFESAEEEEHRRRIYEKNIQISEALSDRGYQTGNTKFLDKSDEEMKKIAASYKPNKDSQARAMSLKALKKLSASVERNLGTAPE